MTRIGNDTKTPATKSTTSGDGARDAKQATQSEDAPTLDELDAGMSLDRSYANPELQSSSVYGGDGQSTARAAVAEAGMSSFESMTPIDETPLARDIAGIEQQCALEMQGHAYELRALGGETGGDDGACLERAADALLTSSEAAGEARPGSALPILEEGVTDASGHVKAVVDEDVRGKGEGLLGKARSRVTKAIDGARDVLRALRPEPRPGETHELGFAGGVGIGVVSGEGKDVVSIGRERGLDGSAGDYVVTRQQSVGVSFGAGDKVGITAELDEGKGGMQLEAGAAIKSQGSVRVEYRSASLEAAHDRVDGLLTNKLLSSAAGAAASMALPGSQLAVSSLVDMGLTDLEGASAVSFTGGSALEACASFNLKAQASGKGQLAMRLELHEGAPARGQLTTTQQLEASGAASYQLLGGAWGGKKEATVSAALTRTTRFDVDDAGKAKLSGEEIGATIDVTVDGRRVKAQLTLPPGRDADAVAKLLDSGDETGALARLLDSGGTVKLERATRQESAVGLSVATGVEGSARAHYAVESSRVLEQRDGRMGDLLKDALSKQPWLAADRADLERQMSAHQMQR